MDPGKLDRRIIIETGVFQPDSFGQGITIWGNAMEVWANMREQTPREMFQSAQPTALQKTVFVIRYLTGISAARNRVKYGGLTYNIVGVTEIGNRREFLQLIGEAENNG